MAALGEILRRFRFHGVPGAAVAFGVPPDRAAELSSEVQGLFCVLAEDQQNAAAVVAHADLEAARIRSASAEHAHRLIAQSHERATTARARAAARIRDESAKEVAAIVAAARSDAVRIAQDAAERLPPLVDDVVRRVLAIGDTG